MKYVRIISLLIIVLGSLDVQAQKIAKNYEFAEELFYSEFLDEAGIAYQKVVNEQPGYKDAAYKLEICDLLSGDRDKSLDKILSFEDTYGKTDKFYNYWLGRIYVSRYQYEDAKLSFNAFLERRGTKSKEIINETKDFIKEAEKRLDFFDKTDNYEIHQLEAPINSPSAELSPAFFVKKDELLFASNRSTGGSKESFSIYHAVRNNDRWEDISEITILGEFARENANVEVVDEDGKLFLFDRGKGDLFYSESRNGQWVQPVEFDTKLKKAHIQSHFFINEHEDRIIFATAAKGSKRTDLDLYQTFKDPESGKWSKPAPFNLVINTPFDEDSPYLSADEQTLYFVSDGHGSVGGLDIYKSQLDPQTLEWSEPVNLGFPINSPDDEFNFKMNPDGKSGYFSSNRLHTTGDFDIYFFWEIEKIAIEGRVFDLAAQQPISSGQIRFTPSQYTDEHFKSEITEEGRYVTEIIADETYLIEIIQDGKTIFTDEFEIHETGGIQTTYLKDFMFGKGKSMARRPVSNPSTTPPLQETESKPITQKPPTNPSTSNPQPREAPVTRSTKPASSAQNAGISSIQDLPRSYSKGRKAILHNVYFAFGTSGLSQGSNEVLNELLAVLKNNPKLKVEIGGHTDNIGSADANQWMSDRRAESVKKWLMERGINAQRMVAKGYGESQPLASNDDEEEGRELNRRIEIFVIEN
jgi:outer membrane protein OmpA-like peptidoglycan-associated protein